MSSVPYGSLSRRERQIMEFLYRKRAATVADILKGIPNPPSYSAVRTTVNILERKGHLRHVKEGKRYLYSPVTSRGKAVQAAVKHLLSTYFDNSLEQAVAALVKLHGKELSEEDIKNLERMIRKHRE